MSTETLTPPDLAALRAQLIAAGIYEPDVAAPPEELPAATGVACTWDQDTDVYTREDGTQWDESSPRWEAAMRRKWTEALGRALFRRACQRVATQALRPGAWAAARAPRRQHIASASRSTRGPTSSGSAHEVVAAPLRGAA